MYSKELFKGTLKTIVLHMLQREGRMYGYQITQRVKELSNGELELTEGALYPTLHKLERAGLVVAEKERVGGRLRKYYQLSPSGETEAVNYLADFRQFVLSMSRMLQLKLD
jgi:DNA-binding PadR family transcriptional regulator